MSLHARDLMLVAVGGAIGSVARYFVGQLMGPRADNTIPWHTFVVNATGAFAIGLVLVLAARHGWPGWWRPLIAVGILGGYTTFSTFSLEIVALALHGSQAYTLAYGLGSLAAGVLGAYAGIITGRTVA